MTSLLTGLTSRTPIGKIDNEGGPVMGLDGPAREIQVEPVTVPEPAREPTETPAPAEPVTVPEKEPVAP